MESILVKQKTTRLWNALTLWAFRAALLSLQQTHGNYRVISCVPLCVQPWGPKQPDYHSMRMPHTQKEFSLIVEFYQNQYNILWGHKWVHPNKIIFNVPYSITVIQIFLLYPCVARDGKKRKIHHSNSQIMNI